MIKEMLGCEIQTICFEWTREDIKNSAICLSIDLNDKEISEILWNINDEYTPENGVSCRIVNNAIIDYRINRDDRC